MINESWIGKDVERTTIIWRSWRNPRRTSGQSVFGTTIEPRALRIRSMSIHTVTVAINSQRRNRKWEQNDFSQWSCKFHYRRKAGCRVTALYLGRWASETFHRQPPTPWAGPGRQSCRCRLVRLKQWAGCSEESLTLLCTLGSTCRPRYTSQTNTPPQPRKDRHRPQRAFTPSSLKWDSYDEFNLVCSKNASVSL